MNRTGKARLLKLADFLETSVPRKRFSMEEWVAHDSNAKTPKECGFAGCAMGWATAIPSFRRAGLHLNDYGTLYFLEASNWEGVTAFFDFDDGYDAKGLFAESSYLDGNYDPTPKQVAKRIREFVTTA